MPAGRCLLLKAEGLPQARLFFQTSSGFIEQVDKLQFFLTIVAARGSQHTVSKLVRDGVTVHLMSGVFGEIPSAELPREGAADERLNEHGQWRSPARPVLPAPEDCTRVGPDGWMMGCVTPNGAWTGLPPVMMLDPAGSVRYDAALTDGIAAVDLPGDGWFRFEDNEPQSFASNCFVVDWSTTGFAVRTQATACFLAP